MDIDQQSETDKYIYIDNNFGNLQFGDPTLDHQIAKYNFPPIFLAIRYLSTFIDCM